MTIAAVIWMLAAAANAGLLDGQTFEGTVTEKGKEPGKDTFVFKDDTLLSTGCVDTVLMLTRTRLKNAPMARSGLNPT